MAATSTEPRRGHGAGEESPLPTKPSSGPPRPTSAQPLPLLPPNPGRLSPRAGDLGAFLSIIPSPHCPLAALRLGAVGDIIPARIHPRRPSSSARVRAQGTQASAGLVRASVRWSEEGLLSGRRRLRPLGNWGPQGGQSGDVLTCEAAGHSQSLALCTSRGHESLPAQTCWRSLFLSRASPASLSLVPREPDAAAPAPHSTPGLGERAAGALRPSFPSPALGSGDHVSRPPLPKPLLPEKPSVALLRGLPDPPSGPGLASGQAGREAQGRPCCARTAAASRGSGCPWPFFHSPDGREAAAEPRGAR